ncbi:DeoR/GlpR transcriptional regulator, partial [Enterococcus faecalis]
YKGLDFEDIDFLVIESRLPDDLERTISDSNVSIINSK